VSFASADPPGVSSNPGSHRQHGHIAAPLRPPRSSYGVSLANPRKPQAGHNSRPSAARMLNWRASSIGNSSPTNANVRFPPKADIRKSCPTAPSLAYLSRLLFPPEAKWHHLQNPCPPVRQRRVPRVRARARTRMCCLLWQLPRRLSPPRHYEHSRTFAPRRNRAAPSAWSIPSWEIQQKYTLS
jgi:hypothetical protein